MRLLMQHAQDQPTPPSQRGDRQIPDGLEQIVMSCLEKRPADRPRSALELSQSLDALGIEQLWTPERAREWWDAHVPRRVQ